MSARPRIIVAGFGGQAPEFRDDDLLLECLTARGAVASTRPWDDPEVDWSGFDLVVARTVWDYVLRYEEFFTWLDSVRSPVENEPGLIRWNSDKRYMADLAAAGLGVVETQFVGAGEEPPTTSGEVVVKPTISAGGRQTGRFGPGSQDAAAALIAEIVDSGRTAMVQPYLAAVERGGETAVVMIDGKLSHVLRKGAILAADEIAPVRTSDGLRVAEAMYDPDLVVASEARDDELDLATRVIGEVRRRFATTPLIARVDMLRDDSGSPVVLELEAVEPNLYFTQAPGAAERLADAIVARARARNGPGVTRA